MRNCFLFLAYFWDLIVGYGVCCLKLYLACSKICQLFPHFVCEFCRSTLDTRSKQNFVMWIYSALARLSKSIKFSLSFTGGNPVVGKIGFWLVAKQE